MKNYLIYMISVVLSAPLFFSCEDNRMKDMVQDKVYLRQHGTQNVSAFPLGAGEIRYDLWAYKGGTLGASGSVRFTVDTGILDAYNADAAQDAQLQMLPVECYRIPYSEFHVSGDSPAAKFYFYYDPDVIAANYGTGRKFALPMRIEADGIEVNEEQASAMIIFDINYMLVGFEEYLPVVHEITSSVSSYTETLTLAIPSEIPSDIMVVLSTDDTSYVNEYNAEYGTSYTLLPSEYYSIENDEPVIVAGQTSSDVSIRVNAAQLPVGEFVLPVAIESAQGASINPERRVCYFVYLNSSEWLTTALDKTSWSIVNISSNGWDGATTGGHKLIDGDNGSYWGVNYTISNGLWDESGYLLEGKDQWAIIDFGSSIKVTAVRITARSSGHAVYTMQLYLAAEAPASSAYTPSWDDDRDTGFLYDGLYTISTVGGVTTIADDGDTAEADKWTPVTDIFSGGSLTVEKTLANNPEGRYLLLRMPTCVPGTALGEIDIQRQK